jgi:magnesium transporter
MKSDIDHLNEPILRRVRTDFPVLREEFTVQQALEVIRREGVGERIVYFYVVDETGRLKGVLPTRRLLTAPLDARLNQVMVSRVIAIPETATVLDACELFVLHKFLAFPVVDSQRRMRGVVEVGLLTDEVTAQSEDPEERQRMDELFETIGCRVSELRGASPLKSFRLRFPWLLATIGSGTVGALLAGAYETTLAQSLVLAFFLMLVLGLAESVSAQSMSVTIQGLRARPPSRQWYWSALRREMSTALLLGLACGSVVALIVLVWRGPGWPAAVIGGSIAVSLCMACLLGLSVPSLLHALKLDPKIAAGPITLAIADLFTLLFYLTLGQVLLGGG